MNKAPWPDQEGNDLFEGDIIVHPSGQSGKIIFKPEGKHASDQWFVKYHNEYAAARLCLQIGDKGRAVKTTTMADEAKAQGRSHFRGHPIVWVNDAWLYEDDLKPIPGWGGENKPCTKCGSSKWSGEGEVDECLGLLPGVDNACCGHGIPGSSWVRFTNGVVLKGFTVESPKKPSISWTREDDGWRETSANINALPVGVKNYIHDLETNADPSGTVLENALLRDQIKEAQDYIVLLQQKIRCHQSTRISP